MIKLCLENSLPSAEKIEAVEVHMALFLILQYVDIRGTGHEFFKTSRQIQLSQRIRDI